MARRTLFHLFFGVVFSVSSVAFAADLATLEEEAQRLTDLAYEQQRAKEFEKAADTFEQAATQWEKCLEADPESKDAKRKLSRSNSSCNYCLNVPLQKSLRQADSLAREGKVVEASETYVQTAVLYHQANERRSASLFKNNYFYCLTKSGVAPIKHADEFREKGELLKAVELYKLGIRRCEEANEKVPHSMFTQNQKYAQRYLSQTAFDHLLENHQPAPDIKLKTEAGDTIELTDYHGHPVLLVFWASWCGSCRRDLPMTDKLHKEYSKKGLVVLGVNVERNAGWARGNIKRAEEMMTDKFSFSNVWADQAALDAYGQPKGVPYFVWIDAQGMLSSTGLDGEDREKSFRDTVKPLLDAQK